MNLRFVFSLIVSLLSLLPAAAQDLTRNWIRERIFLDAEGKKCVTSVQYFDGIGRETLLLTDGLSPAGGVAGALTGESFAGRTSAKWLPATGLTGFDFLTPERVKSLAVSSHEGDSVPFSLTRRDALGRVSSVRNAGGDLAGKAQLSDYTVNRAYAPVKRYCVDASGKLASRGMWREGALRGVLTSDEDGISTEVFSDLRGRKVLERRNGNNDTYFVYDDAGRLSFVLTPGMQEDSNLLKHAYEYRYDRRSECVYSRIPGCEPVEMHRDTAGRTAVVRDGVLRKKGRSRFILYDRLGSVRSVADEDGNVLQQNLYYARGGAWGDVCTAPGFQSYKYCGKYLDRKHGLDLYDYGARLYDPAAAFWTSPDPLCEKYYNISPYAFCNDNPVTFIDPDGRDPGDPFTSLDNAALDFCRIFNYWSMTRNPGYPYGAEYASVFYSYKDKEDNIRYSYYVSEPEKATTCTIKFDPKRIPNKRRESYHFVATGHTHGGYMPGYAGNYFSRIDIVSYYKGRKKYPTCNTAYLATTNGTFMKCIYRKNIDKWMVYSFKGGKYQLPSDANDPTHNKYTYQLITEKFYSTKKFYEIFKSLSKYLGKGEYFK